MKTAKELVHELRLKTGLTERNIKKYEESDENTRLSIERKHISEAELQSLAKALTEKPVIQAQAESAQQSLFQAPRPEPVPATEPAAPVDVNAILQRISETFYSRYQGGESHFSFQTLSDRTQTALPDLLVALKEAHRNGELVLGQSSVKFEKYYFQFHPTAKEQARQQAEFLRKQAQKPNSKPSSQSPGLKSAASLVGSYTQQAKERNAAPEKRSYPEQRNQTEKPGPKPSTRRPRVRPKNNPDLVVIKSHEKGKDKNRHTGNRCGHEIDNPSFYTLKEGSKNRPLCNQEGMKKLEGYYSNPKLLPMLNAARYLEKGSKRKLKQNGRHVQQRSERRNAIVLMAQVMLSCLDIKTMRVLGKKPAKDGTVEGITMEELAKRANITLSRAEEAIKDMVLAGYVKVFPRCEQTDGVYKGYPAIRTVSGFLFKELGLGKLLAESRKFISDRDKEQAQHHYTADVIAKRALLDAMQMEFIEGTTTETLYSQFMGNARATLEA